jgi:hypothetical protein
MSIDQFTNKYSQFMQLSVLVILLLHTQYPRDNYNFAEKIIQPINNMMILQPQ